MFNRYTRRTASGVLIRCGNEPVKRVGAIRYEIKKVDGGYRSRIYYTSKVNEWSDYGSTESVAGPCMEFAYLKDARVWAESVDREGEANLYV